MASTTRDRLLDAALDAFASRGVEGTPITDLEHAAGLAAGSGGFYRYFKTKDELLDAVVHREVDRARAHRVHRPNVPDAPPRTAVEAALHSMLDLLRNQGTLIRLLARHTSRAAELAPLVEEGLLEAGIRSDAAVLAGLMGREDPEELRVLVGVVVVALVGHVLTADYFGHPAAELGDEELVATLADLLAPNDTSS